MTDRRARLACPPVALLAATLLFVPHARAQGALPGDVYYKSHLDQKFQYYVFAGDVVPWENSDQQGTSLSAAATHDTTLATGSLGASANWTATAGNFAADLGSHITEDARTGVYHLVTNTLTVDVYLKGASGTPYWIGLSRAGQADASRLGGLPGLLQPVNGTSTATFLDSIASVNYTGAVSKLLDDTLFVSGNTTSTLVVGADTYSLARTFVFASPTAILQNVCVLGCMTSPATFVAAAGGHVGMVVYPYVSPLAVPAAGVEPGAPFARVTPNPVRAGTTVSFGAVAGAPVRVEAFDVEGRHVATLFDGAATGRPQLVAWNTAALPNGLYFVSAVSGVRRAVARFARVE